MHDLNLCQVALRSRLSLSALCSPVPMPGHRAPSACWPPAPQRALSRGSSGVFSAPSVGPSPRARDQHGLELTAQDRRLDFCLACVPSMLRGGGAQTSGAPPPQASEPRPTCPWCVLSGAQACPGAQVPSTVTGGTRLRAGRLCPDAFALHCSGLCPALGFKMNGVHPQRGRGASAEGREGQRSECQAS